MLRSAPSVLCVALVTLAACTAPSRRVIATGEAPVAIGPYSQAIVAGDLVFVAGQIGLDPGPRTLVPGGLEAEAQQAMTNVRAILAAAGCTLGDLVQVQVFLADIRDYEAFNVVYATFFDGIAPPARAALLVAALPLGARVEILATASRR